MRLAIFLLLPAALSADCVKFPPNLVPFSTVNYVSAANAAGDHLVVGALAGASLNAVMSLIPLPTSTNQTFCDAQVQLAPQQLYANVYLPTSAELTGNFSAFSGLLLNPTNNLPYPNGIIPAGQLGQVFAFRIGGAQADSALRGWSPTGSAPRALFRTPAVLLPSGKVFIPSTTTTDPSLSYDPATGVFSNLATPGFAHGNFAKAILLDNGLVLVAGGQNAPANAELYDPASDKFTPLPVMVQGHGTNFTATKLQDGRVLLVGGTPAGTVNGTTVNSGADLFDPLSKSFSSAGVPVVPRRYHTATLLSDGRVLIAAGVIATGVLNSAEIYDPASNKFTSTGSLGLARFGADAVRLGNGKVLITGGYVTGGASELFDPASGTFSPTGSSHQDHADGGAVLLSSGQALIFGGGGDMTAAKTTETYSPDSGVFSLTGGLGVARYSFSSALLPDGRVFVVGGAPNAAQIATASAEIFTPLTQGLVASQTGLTFRAAQTSTTPASQTIAVLSPTDTIAWTTSVKTYSGGNWLSVTPQTGNSIPGAAPVPLTITVDPSGLTAQDFYGAVILTPTDQKHPPISVVIVFSVVPIGAPAPVNVSPNGLVFTSVSGTSAKPQTLKISSAASAAVGFTATASGGLTWLDFTPKSGTITSVLPATITITPSNATLAAGVYRGSIKLAFSDGTAQTVDLLLVVSAAPKSSSATFRSATGCTPTRLLPVMTSLGTGFNAPVAWPVALSVQVVDDCGSNVDSGSVVVSFTNGDAPLSLLDLGGGVWTGTWVPVRNVASSTVRADAQSSTPALSGTVQVTVQVASNPKVPVVANGGVISSGDYVGSPALGLLVSIFGTALADDSLKNTALPLPEQLGSTHVLLAGVELPLLYVSDSQVNVLVPYNIAKNASYQLVVQRGSVISVPITTAIFDTQPAILSTAGNGIGQGHVYKVDGTLADTNSPATAGDALVIYCVGLGAVSPTVNAGDPSPASPLSSVPVSVTVTIGGVPANSFFAGLTPGFAGLYQINVTVPAGIAPGAQVPVTISVAGKSSSANVFLAVK